MAVGDDATAAGYALVPETGSDDALIKYGAREINRTRDFLAVVKGLIPANKTAARTAAGISSGTEDPNNANGDDGDIYFKII